ncbi:Uncharacterised protein [Mycobacteroides abscessus subsp. abscessus]|nr:Uncharacterised protein [Mycobacteroides abscessus subsp. abscessus]SIN16125.1 Uncharacterised protein [Mycobacteroides abscessus subsp. abscessus]
MTLVTREDRRTIAAAGPRVRWPGAGAAPPLLSQHNTRVILSMQNPFQGLSGASEGHQRFRVVGKVFRQLRPRLTAAVVISRLEVRCASGRPGGYLEISVSPREFILKIPSLEPTGMAISHRNFAMAYRYGKAIYLGLFQTKCGLPGAVQVEGGAQSSVRDRQPCVRIAKAGNGSGFNGWCASIVSRCSNSCFAVRCHPSPLGPGCAPARSSHTSWEGSAHHCGSWPMLTLVNG